MGFDGLRIVSFAPDLADLIRRVGGQVVPVGASRTEGSSSVHRAVGEIADGRVDIVLFTDASQVHDLVRSAGGDGRERALREAMGRTCLGVSGPRVARALRAADLVPDYEPETPDSVEGLVRELGRRCGDLLEKKRKSADLGVNTLEWRRTAAQWGQEAERRAITNASPFMKACRREKAPYTPIWLMRQAGRYQREYRELRATVPFLELCKTPDLAAEITLMAVDRLGVDAAIIFADILLVLEPMGVGLEFSKGEGPVIRNPVRSAQDLDRLLEVSASDLSYVFEAVRITRNALRPDIPLIGFSGAPFTVASYVVEGGGSRHYEHTKGLMYRDGGAWNDLLERLTRLLLEYLKGQIAAGADAVQLFDSWVGCLSPDDYERFVLPHMTRLIGGLTGLAPVIHFATGNPSLLELMRRSGAEVIGLDWRVDLADAWRRLGDGVAVMGNLDPIALFASPEEIRNQAKRILDKAAGRPGHIFNLGHGILPGIPPDHVTALIDAVHELSAS